VAILLNASFRLRVIAFRFGDSLSSDRRKFAGGSPRARLTHYPSAVRCGKQNLSANPASLCVRARSSMMAKDFAAAMIGIIMIAQAQGNAPTKDRTRHNGRSH
jgi:hypothetical protein